MIAFFFFFFFSCELEGANIPQLRIGNNAIYFAEYRLQMERSRVGYVFIYVLLLNVYLLRPIAAYIYMQDLGSRGGAFTQAFLIQARETLNLITIP